MPEYQIHWSDIGECVAEVVHGYADARLIAAAPDLLEALQYMVNACPAIDTSGEDAHARAQAIIAKATGDQE